MRELQRILLSISNPPFSANIYSIFLINLYIWNSCFLFLSNPMISKRTEGRPPRQKWYNGNQSSIWQTVALLGESVKEIRYSTCIRSELTIHYFVKEHCVFYGKAHHLLCNKEYAIFCHVVCGSPQTVPGTLVINAATTECERIDMRGIMRKERKQCSIRRCRDGRENSPPKLVEQLSYCNT